jgi:hypothetical protein
MKKCILLALYITYTLNGMEIIEWNPQTDYLPEVTVHRHFLNNHSFHDATVFNWKGYIHAHEQIAQTATTVHSHRDTTLLPEYDYVVAPRLLDSVDGLTLYCDLCKIRNYIKTDSTLLGTIRTQTNGTSIPQFAFTHLYAQIYNAMPPEERKHFDVDQKILTDDEAKKNILEMGYDIISYIPQNYNILITNKPEFKCRLRNFFSEVLAFLKITGSESYQLCNLLVSTSIKQLKKNDNQELIYPYNITEINLRKKELSSYEK